MDRDKALVDAHFHRSPGSPIGDEAVARALDHLRHARHEWSHYDQYLTTPVGALLHRLRVSRRFAATQVLADLARSTGRLTSLPGLIARETALREPFITTSRVLSEHGARNLQFWEFLWRLEAVLMGAVWHQAAVAEIWHSLFGIEVHREFLGVDRVGGFSHRCDLEVLDQDTFRSGDTTLKDLLEGSSRLTEYHMLQPIVGVQASTEFLATGSSTYWSTTAAACKALDVAPDHPVIRVLHEVALEQFPDVELLRHSSVEALDWNTHYPGRFYDRALATLDASSVPRRMTLDDAYELVAARCLLRDTEPMAAATTAALEFGSAASSLHARASVSTMDFASRHHTEHGQTLIDEFAGLTLTAGLALRARDPLAFLRSYERYPEEVAPDLVATRLPPFVLMDEGFGTHACVNADRDEHIPLVVDSLFELAIDELADTGNCRISSVMYNEIVRWSGPDAADVVTFLFTRRTTEELTDLMIRKLRGDV